VLEFLNFFSILNVFPPSSQHVLQVPDVFPSMFPRAANLFHMLCPTLSSWKLYRWGEYWGLGIILCFYVSNKYFYMRVSPKFQNFTVMGQSKRLITNDKF
jgi:hypothetical protein